MPSIKHNDIALFEEILDFLPPPCVNDNIMGRKAAPTRVFDLHLHGYEWRHGLYPQTG